MKLQVKRIYEEKARGDGMRILVDRVWPRGMTKEAAALASWHKEVAPSAALRKWFGHDPARWDEFKKKYRRELDSNEEQVASLKKEVGNRRATLLYGARDEVHNHAVVLADYLRGKEG
ncbi:DUF488 domain-containing protein [Parvibaculum sp.]|uniref:DUF488 domain-containing protein n=1 Tax=Parvibaculum sp. TaxID=2024848 RepID=UPI003BA89BF1